MKRFQKAAWAANQAVYSTKLQLKFLLMSTCLLTLSLIPFTSLCHAKQSKSIAEILTEDGRFTTLLSAVGEANLLEFLTNAEAITVLAPTDEAFDLLPNGTVESLLLAENQQRLVEILTYHVVGASLSAEAVKTLSSGETLSGQKLAIVNENNGLFLNGAKVITKDISVANGVVHAIDRVLLPPTQPNTLNFGAFLANDGRFTTLMVAAEAAGFLDPTH
ncbi:fasciclin domain-containing protein [bacterium]|nr:fasciclin domain-containing protein [bacterium]